MKKLFLPLVIFTLSFPLLSCAASFDCAKASNATEKLICSDEKISALDEQLAANYKAALEKATDKDAFKKTQIEWLKQQRACKNASCLTQVYQTRINQLNLSVSSSSAVVDNRAQPSVVGEKPKFQITKGKQFELCRVFNDYLNSSYYKKGDCTINDYPVDIRLRSPEYVQVDIEQYKDQIIAQTNRGVSQEQSINNKRSIQNSVNEKILAAWKLNVDLDNDSIKDSILVVRNYMEPEYAKAKQCEKIAWVSNLAPLDGEKISNKWDGYLGGEPIIFDGRVFILSAEGATGYSLSEPESVHLNHYRSGQSHNGELTIVYPCMFEAKIN